MGQKEAREWVWDGEIRFQAGVEVLVGGSVAPPSNIMQYSTYLSADKSKTGSCAFVIASYELGYGDPNYDPVKPYNGAIGLNVTVKPIAECSGGEISRGGKWRHADEPGKWHAWAGPESVIQINAASAIVLVPASGIAFM